MRFNTQRVSEQLHWRKGRSIMVGQFGTQMNKIADKWSGPQLFERLEAQLAGDYLRDVASNRGIYLLINRGQERVSWQLPTREKANFDELVQALQAHWATVASTHPGVEEIKVIGVDLTKRLLTPRS